MELVTVAEEPNEDVKSKRQLRNRTKKKEKLTKNGKETMKEGAIYDCNVCGKEFADKWNLHSHMKIHATDYAYSCTICKYKCKVKKYLARHMKTAHQERTNYKCEVCGKMFHFKCKMNDHMRVHTGEKPFKCDVCGKAFNSSYSLSTHKYIHTDEKPFQCSFCEYACRDSSTLRKHQAKHMGIEKLYECKMCNKKYKSKRQMKMHVAETHFNVDVKKHACDVCGKSFKEKANLNNHVESVHEKKKSCTCDICGHVVTNKANLPAHIRTHVEARPYRCTFKGCRKRFKDNNTLKKHTMIHYPEKQYPCKLCGRLFARLHRLTKHMVQHRPRVKKVECDYCGVCFYNKNYLACHIRRKHSRKRLKCICDMCDFVTHSKPSLIVHIKHVHDVYNYLECKLCEKSYKTDMHLNMHYRKEHNIKYKMVTNGKSNNKKPLLIIKEEPMDEYNFDVKVKTEPIDEPIEPMDISVLRGQDEFTEDTARSIIKCHSKELSKVPEELFDDFYIRQVPKSPNVERVEEHNNDDEKHVDKRAEILVKKRVKKLLKEVRQRNEVKALERARHQYNERMRKTIFGPSKVPGTIKIKFFKNKDIRNNNNGNTSLKDNATPLDNKNDDETSLNDKNDDGVSSIKKDHVTTYINESNENKISLNNENDDTTFSHNTNSDDNYTSFNDKNDSAISITDNSTSFNNRNNDTTLNDKNSLRNDMNDSQFNDKTDADASSNDHSDYNDSDDEPLINQKKNKKMKFSAQQCYVCFKLFQTKDKLIEHCKDHFDVCSKIMLKKCPLCDFVTNRNLRRHMRLIHKINVKLMYGTINDKRDNKHGSRYSFNVKNSNIKEIEVIPSIKNLNKRAAIDIDKRKREKNDRLIAKTKLVKKGKEWVVEKEKIDVQNEDYSIPEFEENDFKYIQIGEKDDYVGRLKKLSVIAKRKSIKMLYPCESCDKICQTLAALRLHVRKHDPNAKPFKPKVWKHKTKITVSKKRVTKPISTDNRLADPKPIVNKHKCDPKLKEFYEKNIKGGDIEFWHFLKIYNKMCRENVEDFEDLQKHTAFGIHMPFNDDDVTSINEQKITKKSNIHHPKVKNIRNAKTGSYTRVLKISRKEYLKRNAIKQMLREKNKTQPI